MSIVPRRHAVSAPAAVVGPAVPPVPHPVPVTSRIVDRLLEGRHRWGDLSVWRSRSGWTTCELVVVPPGATRSMRIRLRLMRLWPPVGLLLGVWTVAAAGRTLPIAAAILAGVGVYVLGAAAFAALAGPGRHGVRTLRICSADEGTSGDDLARLLLMQVVAAQLVAAERGLRAGRLDEVGFEAAWGSAWRRLADAGSRRA